jgi:hypothetical protein
MNDFVAIDKVDDSIRQEFIDEAGDVLNEINVMLGNLRSKTTPGDQAMATIRRHCHNLRSGVRGVNMPSVELAIIRLEDYIADLNSIAGPQIDDIQAFIDKMAGAIDSDKAARNVDLSQFARELPARKTFEVTDITQLNIEVMLISPQRAMARFVERELQACGYRVTNVKTSFEAIQLAVRTKPDMIICSALLDEISGVDLACALAAMPATCKIPFAVLTSFGWGHSSLDNLPMRCAIIRKGPNFGDDLAEALSRLGVT